MVAIGIGEIHVFQFKLAVNLFGTIIPRRLDVFFRIQNAEEAFGINQRVVHVVEDALQLRDGRDDVAEQHDVVHDFTDGHAGIAY